MISAYTVSENRIRKALLGDIGRELSWVMVKKPEKGEVRQLIEKFSLDAHDVDESLDDDVRSRVEAGNVNLIMLKAPHRQDGDLITATLGLFIVKNTLITITSHSLPPIERFMADFEAGKGKAMFSGGMVMLLSFIFEAVNNDFRRHMERLEDNVELLEERKFTRRDMQKCFDINRTLTYFHRAFIGNLEVLRLLSRGYLERYRKPADIELFEDSYNDFFELLDMERIQRDIVNTIFQLQNTAVQNDLNEVMRKISVFGSLILIPTLISSIYGMNFRHMPLLTSPYGFAVSLAVMSFLVLILLYFFKRKGWC